MSGRGEEWERPLIKNSSSLWNEFKACAWPGEMKEGHLDAWDEAFSSPSPSPAHPPLHPLKKGRVHRMGSGSTLTGLSGPESRSQIHSWHFPKHEFPHQVLSPQGSQRRREKSIPVGTVSRCSLWKVSYKPDQPGSSNLHILTQISS